MRGMGSFGVLVTSVAAALALAACGTASGKVSADSPAHPRHSARPSPSGSPTPSPTPSPSPTPAATHPAPVPPLPSPGNPSGTADVPAAAQPVNTSHPTHVIGDGTPASCTSAAVVAAVAAGGIITFSCGPAPVTITMQATAVVANSSAEVVLDGGGRVILSGAGVRRILFLDTCSGDVTSSDCWTQAEPRLTVQNMTFEDGNSTDPASGVGGGGAIFDRGGQLTVINSSFTDNRCTSTGPDLGGAAIRALGPADEQGAQANPPVYIVGSTFRGGVCSNGGALSSIGVTWDVLNSVMTGNQAIGYGANPAAAGTPGGGSGAAIYTDGDSYDLTVAGSVISGNTAREGGGAIFYVSDDNTGALRIEDSTLHDNPSEGFQTAGYPGIFFHSSGSPIVAGSSLS
jgi:hypothetical protein